VVHFYKKKKRITGSPTTFIKQEKNTCAPKMFGFTRKMSVGKKRGVSLPKQGQALPTAIQFRRLLAMNAETAFIEKVWGDGATEITFGSIMDSQAINELARSRMLLLFHCINITLGASANSSISRKDWFMVYENNSTAISTMVRKMTPFELFRSIDVRLDVLRVFINRVTITVDTYRGMAKVRTMFFNGISFDTTDDFSRICISGRSDEGEIFRSSQEREEFHQREEEIGGNLDECYNIFGFDDYQEPESPSGFRIYEVEVIGSESNIVGNGQALMTVTSFKAVQDAFVKEFIRRSNGTLTDVPIISAVFPEPHKVTLESGDTFLSSEEDIAYLDRAIAALDVDDSVFVTHPIGRILTFATLESILGPDMSPSDFSVTVVASVRARVEQFPPLVTRFVLAGLDAIAKVAAGPLVVTRGNIAALYRILETSRDPNDMIFSFADTDDDGVLGTREDIDLWAHATGAYFEDILTYEGHEGYAERMVEFFRFVKPPLTAAVAESIRDAQII
jgi:hypothetical protein